MNHNKRRKILCMRLLFFENCLFFGFQYPVRNSKYAGEVRPDFSALIGKRKDIGLKMYPFETECFYYIKCGYRILLQIDCRQEVQENKKEVFGSVKKRRQSYHVKN